MITYEEIKKNEELNTYITLADESLLALGFTEHSFAHVTKVALGAEYILTKLGADAHTVELAKIAGYMHDIGNLVNRIDHSQSGAIMAFRILDHLDMPARDVATVVTAIGNHDEGTGVAVNDVAAALILADKCDVRRSRVRNREASTFDIHDRVNYAVEYADLHFNEDQTAIVLDLKIDTEISSVLEYFEIFMQRMLLCKRAALFFHLKFKMYMNGSNVL